MENKDYDDDDDMFKVKSCNAFVTCATGFSIYLKSFSFNFIFYSYHTDTMLT